MEIATCRQAIEARLPHLHIRSLRPITEGWDSFVLEVNGEIIFRFPRRLEVEAALEMEACLLPALAPTLSLPVPRFAHLARRADGWPVPFAAYRRIPGAQFDPTLLPPTLAKEAAHRLGCFLGELQRFPRAQAVCLGVPDATPARWHGEYRALYASVRRQVLPLLTPAARARWQALWEAFLARSEHLRFQPALLHHDLVAEHILYDPAQGALAGVIDWSDAAIGDPAFDLAGLLHDYGRAFVEEALVTYPGPAEEALLERARFYAAIIPFHEVRHGLRVNDRQHVQRGLARLEAAP